MIHLDKNVLDRVVVEQIAGHARALRHPIQPKPATGPVNVVPADLNVNGAVKLDAGHLRARKQFPDVNVVDGIAGDGAERSAQAADDARLFAMRDGVVANEVVADVFTGPAVGESTVDGFDVALGGIGRVLSHSSPYLPARCPNKWSSGSHCSR